VGFSTLTQQLNIEMGVTRFLLTVVRRRGFCHGPSPFRSVGLLMFNIEMKPGFKTLRMHMMFREMGVVLPLPIVNINVEMLGSHWGLNMIFSVTPMVMHVVNSLDLSHLTRTK
jgi:hypothetical protein